MVLRNRRNYRISNEVYSGETTLNISCWPRVKDKYALKNHYSGRGKKCEQQKYVQMF